MKGKEVRHITVPAYDNCSLNAIADFCHKYPDVFNYLPDGSEVHKVPKSWLCNTIHSVAKDNFKNWVRQQVEERNALVISKKNCMIDMDHELAEAFAASTKVSRRCQSFSLLLIYLYNFSVKGNRGQSSKD